MRATVLACLGLLPLAGCMAADGEPRAEQAWYDDGASTYVLGIDGALRIRDRDDRFRDGYRVTFDRIGNLGESSAWHLDADGRLIRSDGCQATVGPCAPFVDWTVQGMPHPVGAAWSLLPEGDWVAADGSRVEATRERQGGVLSVVVDIDGSRHGPATFTDGHLLPASFGGRERTSQRSGLPLQPPGPAPVGTVGVAAPGGAWFPESGLDHFGWGYSHDDVFAAIERASASFRPTVDAGCLLEYAAFLHPPEQPGLLTPALVAEHHVLAVHPEGDVVGWDVSVARSFTGTLEYDVSAQPDRLGEAAHGCPQDAAPLALPLGGFLDRLAAWRAPAPQDVVVVGYPVARERSAADAATFALLGFPSTADAPVLQAEVDAATGWWRWMHLQEGAGGVLDREGDPPTP